MVRRIDDINQLDLGLIEVPRTFHAPAAYTPCNEFPDLDGIVAIDLETKDPGIGNGTGSSWPLTDVGFVCGVAIRWAGGKMYYPLRHAAGNITQHDDVFWTWLMRQLAKPNVICVMANAVYDTGWLRRHGVVLANPPIDVQVMAFLLDEHRRSYALSALAKAFLGRDKSNLTLIDMARGLHIPHPMSNMDKLPAWVVEPYALDDVDLTYDLYFHLLDKIIAEGLGKVLRLESECTLVSVDMRSIGVRVDLDQVERLKPAFQFKRQAALDIIKDSTGILMQPFENEAAARALRVENPSVVLGITPAGGTSVAAGVLREINSPVSNAILTARKFDKAIGTFLEGYLEKFVHRGRIHAEFHSTRNNSSNDDDVFGDDSMFGASSGRWASSNPNLQNIPIRDPEIGPAIRSCFVPEQGERWVKLDYASQEPRLTVHFAHLVRINNRPLRGAAEMVERFQRNPLTDLHGECATMMGVPRGPAKIINLALAYGMQGASLCRSLGLPTKTITSRRTGQQIEVAGDEGQRLLDKHYAAVPFVKDLFDIAKNIANTRGYVQTISGRKIRFEKYPDGNYARIHKALNGVIQGSAADQMKMALVALRGAGLPVNLTVHDEADRSVPMGVDGELMIERMVEIMEDVIQISVPMIAEAKVGANWGACA